MWRERVLWEHVCERCPTVPWLYVGAVREGIFMRDGGMTLLDAMVYHYTPAFPWLRILLDLRTALVHLHRGAGIEHCDVCPRNVLLRFVAPGVPIVSVVDLTNAALPVMSVEARPRYRDLRCSSNFRCPQEALGEPTPLFSRDAWSVGALALWMVTDLLPPRQSDTVHRLDAAALDDIATFWGPGYLGETVPTTRRGRRLVRAICTGRTPEGASLNVSIRAWPAIQAMVARLLSFDPAERVAALHDDAAWQAVHAHALAVGADMSPAPARLPAVPVRLPPPLAPRTPYPPIHTPRSVRATLDVLHDTLVEGCAHPSMVRVWAGLVHAFHEYTAEHPRPGPPPSRRHAMQHTRALALAVVEAGLAMEGGVVLDPADLVRAPRDYRLPHPEPDRSIVMAVIAYIWLTPIARNVVREISGTRDATHAS